MLGAELLARKGGVVGHGGQTVRVMNLVMRDARTGEILWKADKTIISERDGVYEGEVEGLPGVQESIEIRFDPSQNMEIDGSETYWIHTGNE